KRGPVLGRGPVRPDQVLGDCSLGDLETQLQEFPVNPGRTPERVGVSHRVDEGSDLRGDGRAAWPVPPALAGPEELEACPMPPDDRLGVDDGDGLRPAPPELGEENPERPVGGTQAWTPRGALEDGQLVAQREVLEHQGAAGPDPTEEAGEDEGDHGGHHPSGQPKVQCWRGGGVNRRHRFYWRLY